jgi:hypothetical protein
LETFWDNLGWSRNLSPEENLVYDAIYSNWMGDKKKALTILREVALRQEIIDEERNGSGEKIPTTETPSETDTGSGYDS